MSSACGLQRARRSGREGRVGEGRGGEGREGEGEERVGEGRGWVGEGRAWEGRGTEGRGEVGKVGEENCVVIYRVRTSQPSNSLSCKSPTGPTGT